MDGSKSGTPGPSFEVLTSVLFGRGSLCPNFVMGIIYYSDEGVSMTINWVGDCGKYESTIYINV